jgi:hypothetical protein
MKSVIRTIKTHPVKFLIGVVLGILIYIASKAAYNQYSL